MFRHASLLLLLLPALAAANPPVASYIFPAGGQRGTRVPVRVGGLFLYQECGFEMLGSGVTAPGKLKRTKTVWFEGPLLPLPDSQRQEDYPRDMAGQITLAADAQPGLRYWRLWTSQGATSAMKFVVGELPEIVENEIDGEPAPVKVTLPLTINGRIFPRENIDVWSVQAVAGQTIRCEVHAARLGSPLDARLEVRDAQERKIAENDDHFGADPVVTFTAPSAGTYHIRIQDTQNQGSQAHVYRLTLTSQPWFEQVFPLGGRRGDNLELSVFGQQGPAKLKVHVPKDAPADFVLPASVRQPSPVLLDIDDLPEVVRNADGQTPKFVLPAMLNGRIAQPGQIDTWPWTGRKGDTWEFELRAARLGSRLDGVLFITDGAGKVLARAEANPLDPVLHFQVPADGTYVVGVQDRFQSRGGPEFAYRLRIAAPPPAGFRLSLGSDALNLPRKGSAKLKINLEVWGGFKELITLEVRGLPPGVKFTGPGTLLNAGRDDPPALQLAVDKLYGKKGMGNHVVALDLVFTADDKARIDVSRLHICGKTRDGGEVQAGVKVGRGQPDLTSMLLAVTLPTPFVIKGEYEMGFAARGGMHKRKYKIIRNGFEGPIEISPADRQARHLQGVECPTIIVPAGVSEFTYAAYMPPWMETGRTSRTCVMGVGVIKEPDGSEHRVSFSSVNQNEQLVAVVGPSKLAMSAERTSYAAQPGTSFTVPVRIQRGQGIAGPVELDLIVPAHVTGLTAGKATITAKQDQGTLTVHCAAKMGGPFNMPIIVRATLIHERERLVAEVKLDVQP